MANSTSSSPRPTVPPKQAKLNQCTHVQQLHDNELGKIGYLGAPNADQKYRWFQMGSGRILMNGNAQDNTPPDEVIPAELFLYTTVSSEDCFLHPTGNWQKPTLSTQSIADVKLSMKGAKPMGSGCDVSNVFDVAIKNLESLQKKAAVTRASKTCTILTQSKLMASSTLPKFCFALFSWKSASGEEPTANGDGSPIVPGSLVNAGDLEANCEGMYTL
ncbi:hypothetical protein V5O48_011646 [Marasmius crinis-equi]|uniref:Uncharacterized protein n=1 Tax=Marasmius crinis-equi TaxID=585013 RepID=A0ABR3F4Z9_9AGAR